MALTSAGRKRLSRAQLQRDLEQLRPVLAGDEQPVAGGVVGDAVEHVGLARRDVRTRQQARQVDPAHHMSAGRIDAGDQVGLPDVGVELALDPFQFVEVVDRAALVGDVDAALFPERLGG